MLGFLKQQVLLSELTRMTNQIEALRLLSHRPGMTAQELSVLRRRRIQIGYKRDFYLDILGDAN